MLEGKNTIGDFLRIIRTEYLRPPMTQTEFAEKICKISRSFYANIENNNRPPHDELIDRIAAKAGKNSMDRSFFARELHNLLAKRQNPKFVEEKENEIHLLNNQEVFLIPYELTTLIEDHMASAGISFEMIAEGIGISFIECRKMIKGISPIKRQDFVYLANTLGQNPDAWLNFVRYIPTEIVKSISEYFRKNPDSSIKELAKKISSS